MSTHSVLVDARNLLEGTWCVGGPNPANHTDRHCLLSAIGYAAGARTYGELAASIHDPEVAPNPEVLRDARRVLADLTGTDGLWGWNDAHPKEEVLALLDRAISATAPEPDWSAIEAAPAAQESLRA